MITCLIALGKTLRGFLTRCCTACLVDNPGYGYGNLLDDAQKTCTRSPAACRVLHIPGCDSIDVSSRIVRLPTSGLGRPLLSRHGLLLFLSFQRCFSLKRCALPPGSFVLFSELWSNISSQGVNFFSALHAYGRLFVCTLRLLYFNCVTRPFLPALGTPLSAFLQSFSNALSRESRIPLFD